MNWYEIVAMLLGGGVVSGIVTLYNARSNKDTIDIGNLRALIDEERKERQMMAKEHQDYRDLVEQKVEQVRARVERLEADNQRMTRAIYMAYRCRFPERDADCPVIKAYEACAACEKKER